MPRLRFSGLWGGRSGPRRRHLGTAPQDTRHSSCRCCRNAPPGSARISSARQRARRVAPQRSVHRLCRRKSRRTCPQDTRGSAVLQCAMPPTIAPGRTACKQTRQPPHCPCQAGSVCSLRPQPSRCTCRRDMQGMRCRPHGDDQQGTRHSRHRAPAVQPFPQETSAQQHKACIHHHRALAALIARARSTRHSSSSLLQQASACPWGSAHTRQRPDAPRTCPRRKAHSARGSCCA